MMPSLHIGEINSGIHMYQFTFETLTPLFSDVVVVSDLKKHFGESTDLVKKWYGSADLHTYPYSIPSFKIDVRPFPRSTMQASQEKTTACIFPSQAKFPKLNFKLKFAKKYHLENKFRDTSHAHFFICL